jgi:hypothetical protein
MTLPARVDRPVVLHRAHDLTDHEPRVLSRHASLIRSEAAVLRTLLDELERILPGSGVEARVSAQLVEEAARLGCRLLEGAAALTKAVDIEESRSSGTRLTDAGASYEAGESF